MSFDMQVSMPHFKGHKKGRIYLTTHRVSSFYFIRLSSLTSRAVGFVIQFMYICIEMSRWIPYLFQIIFTNKDNKDTLQSFSMPFYSMKEVELEQPIFGANYIKGKVISEQNGKYTLQSLRGPSKWAPLFCQM